MATVQYYKSTRRKERSPVAEGNSVRYESFTSFSSDMTTKYHVDPELDTGWNTGWASHRSDGGLKIGIKNTIGILSKMLI